MLWWYEGNRKTDLVTMAEKGFLSGEDGDAHSRIKEALADIGRAHLIDDVCVQEVLPPEE